LRSLSRAFTVDEKLYDGMKAHDAKERKTLRKENVQIKRIVADRQLENVALREISQGNS